jgi:hypothetical protein
MPKVEFAQEPVTVSSSEVLELTTETLKEHFNLLIDSHRYTEETIFHILVKASAEANTIEDTCNRLESASCSNAIRYQLKKNLLVDIKSLEDEANKALLEHLPPGIKGKKQEGAIDLVFIPYHGEAYQSEDEIRRSQAKSGTTHFHCYATAYVIKKNKRLTLALTYVRKNDSLIDVLERLFALLARIEVSFRRLYLDKGFYQVDVIRFLIGHNIPAIIPVIMRGKKGGPRRLLKGRKSYQTTYTMKSQKYGQVSFDVWVVRKYSKGKYGRHGVEWFCYAILGETNLSPLQVYEGYRRRFGIESSYRLMNEVRARTTSRNPALRLLLVGIAFIILNIWVYLKWILGQPRRGGRYIHRNLFVLSQLRLFLTEAVKQIYGVTLTIRQPLSATSPQSCNF